MRIFLVLTIIFLLSVNSIADDKQELFDKARLLYNEGVFIEAIDLYKGIIQDEPLNLEARLNLAYLYKDLAEHKEAIEVMKTAPLLLEDFKTRKFISRLYYLSGEPEKAIPMLEESLTYYPDDSEVLLYLGLCYQDIGNLTKANRYFLDALRVNPNEISAYLKLGNIYFQKQEFSKATETYQKIIELDPSIVEARIRLAECFRGLGEYKEAYKQYAKCVAIEPGNKGIQIRLEEMKVKLGKTFLAEKKASILERHKIKSIEVKPSPYAEVAPIVRVGIAKINGSIEFKCGRTFEIIDREEGRVIFKGRKESVYSLVFNKKQGVNLRAYEGDILLSGLNRPFLIKNESKDSVITVFDLSYGEGSFWAGWHDQQYRGVIEVIPGDKGFQLINIVNLEEYLYSVLPSEMPVGWPRQALCAQAIAARTWAVRNMARHNRQGFNFCSSVHCQVYKGTREETGSTNQAVDETAGIILVSGDQPNDIFYSSNCGGCTQEGIIDALAPGFYFPLSPLELEGWLKDGPGAFCNLKGERLANFRWIRIYKKEQLQEMFDRSGIKIGELVTIVPQKRLSSGHLISLKIEGKENSEIIEGENNIRRALGDLRSSAFKLEIKFDRKDSPVEFIFYGAGFGHGRGLCQSGIKGMALKGHSYLGILKHYYPASKTNKKY